ncbi:MAG TPA: hypothetical protein VE781_01340, partial [Kineosporiaceae bacterium]|nr:hypothetical protein [Kineosporiaceae bacterium]
MGAADINQIADSVRRPQRLPESAARPRMVLMFAGRTFEVPAPPLTEAEFDNALEAIADFTDLKSPFFGGHSSGVAALAAAAAAGAGHDPADITASVRLVCDTRLHRRRREVA